MRARTSSAGSSLRVLAESSRQAARALATTPSNTKDGALREIGRALRAAERVVLRANARDLATARAANKPSAFIDRLALDSKRLAAMARAVEDVASLPDPVGEVTETWRRPNGLKVEKVRIPLGVVLMIYEARPNVTSDASALCLKSGNAVILRGGSEALESNRAIAAAVQVGLRAAGLPELAVQLVPTAAHDALLELLKLEGLIDLCIPRGGEGLIRFVAENARIPVVKHYKGVCHVYVHEAADLEMAEEILVNAKVQRPGVCNAAECLLVDRAVAGRFLPKAGRALAAAGVELRACPTSQTLLKRAGVQVREAAPDDYGREFLSLTLAVRVVKDLGQALEHIARYGSEHTEAVVTQDLTAAERFANEVTASAVMINASTRFNDGGELGLGAEIGISTSRLHAFGPMGLKEMTSQKYVVRGNGQTRR
jgi:glutamate-5-semialdehyde dehydrogenase